MDGVVVNRARWLWLGLPGLFLAATAAWSLKPAEPPKRSRLAPASAIAPLDSLPPIEPRAELCTLAIEAWDVLGRRVPAARVEVTGELAHQALTDVNGEVEIADLPASLYEVTIDHPAIGQATSQLLLCPRDRVVSKIVFGSGGVLRGRVLTEEKRGIEGATINLVKGDVTREVAADRQGRFEILGLERGDWSIAARAPGFRASLPRSIPIAGASIEQRTDLILERALRIAGHVVEDGGLPLSGWTISAVKTGAAGRESIPALDSTNGAGWFAIDHVEPGENTLLASGRLRDGPELVKLSVLAQGGDEDVTIRVPLAATIIGEVVFEGADPPPFYRVSAAGASIESAISDRTFRLRVLRAGSIDVTAQAEGWISAVAKVAVLAGEQASVLLVMHPRREIRGEVVDHKTQRPIPGVRLTLNASDHFGRWRHETGEDGRFAFAWVPPQFATISVDHPSYPRGSFPVVDGFNKIDLSEGVPVDGMLFVGAMSEPDTLVRVVRPWDPPETQLTTTDRAGGFALSLPSAGEKIFFVQLRARPELIGRELSYSWFKKIEVPLEGLRRLKLRNGPHPKVIFDLPELRAPLRVTITHRYFENENSASAEGTIPPGPPRRLLIDQLPPGNYFVTVFCASPWIDNKGTTLRLPLGFPQRLDHF